MRNTLIIVGLLLISFTRLNSQVLTANASSVDITPPLAMKYTLGGYGDRMNKPATGIHDRIMAKALSIKSGNHKYMVITLDVLGLPTNIKADLIKRISAAGWSHENVMLLPSHSHGSLEMEALNNRNQLNIPQIGIYQPELVSFLLDKLELLVGSVDQNYREVRIGTGIKTLENLNRNRRKEQNVEKDLIITRVDLKNGNPLAVLVNWTAHPTFLGDQDMEVSAEWPGYLQSHLQNLIGYDVTVMYYNGAEGDQSPVLSSNESSYQKIETYGKLIAQKAFEVYKQIKPAKVKDFTSSYQHIQLPEHKAHPSFMKTGGEEYGLTEATVKVVMNMLAPTSTDIGVLKLGDLVIVGIPGEMTAILGQQVKAGLKVRGAKQVAIGGLANEWISYILNKQQYNEGEGYESSVSFFGPDLGYLLANEAIRTGELVLKK